MAKKTQIRVVTKGTPVIASFVIDSPDITLNPGSENETVWDADQIESIEIVAVDPEESTGPNAP